MRISKVKWNAAHVSTVAMNVAVVASKEVAAVIVGVETVTVDVVVLVVSKEAEIVAETAVVVSKEAGIVTQLLVVLVWIAMVSLTNQTKTWYV
jgi:hypothetical protein